MINSWRKAGWPIVRLSEIADLFSGGTPSRGRPEFFSGDVPWLTGQDIPEGQVADIEKGRESVSAEAIRNSATRIVPEGSVLMTTRVTVGKAAVAARPLCYSQDITGISLRTNGLVIPHFLAYFLLSQRSKFLSRNQGSTIAGITRDNLSLEQIPLPPLSEQCRIVEILRAAAALRPLRQAARTHATEIFAASFEDSFGDLLRHPAKFDTEPLGRLLNEIETGWSPSAEDRPARPEEWGVLKLSAATLGHYAEGEHKALPSALTPREKLEIKPGDLLLTRKNTKELVGAAAFVWETRPKLMFSDLIFRLKVKSDAPVHPKFLWALFSHPSFRPRISQLADGASGSMPNIPKSRLEKLSIPIPRPELQLRFLAVIDELHSLETTLRGEAAVADELIPSLHSRAFTGELTRVWRQHHQPELEREVKARDHALAAVGSLSAPLSAQPTVKLSDVQQADGDYSELTRDQQRVLEQMEETRRKRQPLDSGAPDDSNVRTADSIASVLVGPLHENVQAVESNLAVLVARGLVTSLSLEQRTPDTNQTVYGNCYRLASADPGAAEDDGAQSNVGVDGTRDQEILRLLGNRKREERVP